MGSPTAPFYLIVSDSERSKSRSLKFRGLIHVSRKGAELGHVLLLNTNREPYMGSPMAPLHLTLSDLEKSWSFKFETLYLIREPG